jgi:hypothetical protein
MCLKSTIVGAAARGTAAGLALFSIAPAAYAYLDPGTGSIIFQGAVAALLAGLFYFKTIWYRIKSFFTGKRHEQEKIELPPAEDTGDGANPKA